MLGLPKLSVVVHHLENMLEQIRQQQWEYKPECGDIIRVVLDEVKISAAKYFNKEPVAKELEYIANAIEYLCNNPQSRNEAIAITLSLLDPLNKGKPFVEPSHLPENRAQESIDIQIDNDASYKYLMEDLHFFKQISNAAEKRIATPPGKTALINKLALKMNALANFKVEQPQLQAAIYLHNFGRSSMAMSLINQITPLTEQEQQISDNCERAAAVFLQNLPFWQPAADIIAQYHERPDGLGYPNKLKKDTICNGAKILAISSAFAEILYSDLKQINTRSIMAAILALNNSVGTKFDEYWVEIFNNSIKILHQEKQLIK